MSWVTWTKRWLFSKLTNELNKLVSSYQSILLSSLKNTARKTQTRSRWSIRSGSTKLKQPNKIVSYSNVLSTPKLWVGKWTIRSIWMQQRGCIKWGLGMSISWKWIRNVMRMMSREFRSVPSNQKLTILTLEISQRWQTATLHLCKENANINSSILKGKKRPGKTVTAKWRWLSAESLFRLKREESCPPKTQLGEHSARFKPACLLQSTNLQSNRQNSSRTTNATQAVSTNLEQARTQAIQAT